MGRGERARIAPLLLAAFVTACAGSAPDPVSEPTPTAEAGDERCEALLARLDQLIAGHTAGAPGDTALLAEARALRSEAVEQLAAGDEQLARDLLTAAVALLERGDG
jgi:hypothetical protein